MTKKDLGVMTNRLRRWVLESRRSPDTWLVTKDHILKPPFSIKANDEKDFVQVKLTGVKDFLAIQMSDVIDSEFRDQLGIFLLDEDSVVRDSHILAPFSRHLQVILDAFPPNSRFKTEELYTKITWSGDSTRAQTHARRRWKELKYRYGFDLDRDSTIYWRGQSSLRQARRRPSDRYCAEAHLDNADIEDDTR
jgi:hypothetical protein